MEPAPTTLFTLPPELRQQIYTHILTPPPKITITTSVKQDHILFSSTSTCKTTIPVRLLLISRAFHSELLPHIYRLLTLYLTFDPKHTLSVEPRQADLKAHVPLDILARIERVVYLFPLFPGLGYGVHERPPREVFEFGLMTGLRRFVVRKSMKVGVGVLESEGCGGVGKTGYLGMGREERLRVWRGMGLVKSAEVVLGIVGRFGRGGWVGKLIEGEEGEGGRRVGVGDGCDLVVEAEIMLFDGMSWRPECVDMVLVEVGIREREVRSVRLIENPYPEPGVGSGRGDEVLPLSSLSASRSQFAFRRTRQAAEV